MIEPKFPDITVQLSGEDGNIFFIVGRISRAMRRAGVSEAEIKEFTDAVTNTESYDRALQTCMAWVDCQ